MLNENGNHKGDKGNAQNQQPDRYSTIRRIPRAPYLEEILGLTSPDPSLDRLKQIYYLNTNPINADYAQHATEAKQFLRHNFAAVNDPVSFAAMMEEYTRISLYDSSAGNISAEMNTQNVRNDVYVPERIAERLLTLRDTLSYTTTPQQTRREEIQRLKKTQNIVLAPLEDRLSKVQQLAKETLERKDLHTAIQTLYVMVKSWLWVRGNLSRSMNFFNVLLEKIGYQPISHGIIDFAALAYGQQDDDNSEDFQRYVMYVMQEVEGQHL